MRPRSLTRRSLEHLDLLALALLSLAACAVLLFEVPPPARIALNLTFVLVAPGFALAALLFPGREDLDSAERLALSLGLSVVAIPLLGWVLSATPWGIRTLPMAAGLTATILAAALGALYRRGRLAPARRSFSRHTLPAFSGHIGLLVAVGLSFTSVVVAAQALRPAPYATEFYVLGSKGRLEGYPTQLAPGEAVTLKLGVRNHEGEPETFRVHAAFADTAPTDALPAAPVAATPLLEDGEVWEAEVALRAPPGGGRTRLTLKLYRARDAQPYRTVHLFLTLVAARPPVSAW